MSKSENEAVARGREAWGRLKTGASWNDWMETGTALQIGRTECLAATHTNDINSKTFRNAMGEWLKANDFGDMDKAVRSRLFECMEHRAEIEAWRATLPMSERLKLNHPHSVLRKWQGSTLDGRATGSPQKPGLRDEVVRLTEELDAANKQLRKIKSDGQDYTMADSDAVIARVWFESPYRAKYLRILRELSKLDTAARKEAGGVVSAGAAAPKVRRGALK